MMSTDTNALGRHLDPDTSSGFYRRQTSGRVRRGWQGIGVMVALTLLVGGGVDLARADEGTPVAGVSGLIGAINPETGQIGPPTAEQLQRLKGNLQRVYTAKVTPRAPVKLPNGATMAVPGPETLSFAVTRLNPDGTLSTTCVSNMQDAVRFWSTPGTHPHHAHQQENHHALR